jgi:predicted nucleotidyltransferase
LKRRLNLHRRHASSGNLAASRDAARVAALHGARVVVFGSLAEGRFHRASDLDLALDGPADALDDATAAVFDAVALHGLEADIVRLDRAEGRLLDRIRRHGRDPADLG